MHLGYKFVHNRPIEALNSIRLLKFISLRGDIMTHHNYIKSATGSLGNKFESSMVFFNLFLEGELLFHDGVSFGPHENCTGK